MEVKKKAEEIVVPPEALLEGDSISEIIQHMFGSNPQDDLRDVYQPDPIVEEHEEAVGVLSVPLQRLYSYKLFLEGLKANLTGIALRLIYRQVDAVKAHITFRILVEFGPKGVTLYTPVDVKMTEDGPTLVIIKWRNEIDPELMGREEIFSQLA